MYCLLNKVKKHTRSHAKIMFYLGPRCDNSRWSFPRGSLQGGRGKGREFLARERAGRTGLLPTRHYPSYSLNSNLSPFLWIPCKKSARSWFQFHIPCFPWPSASPTPPRPTQLPHAHPPPSPCKQSRGNGQTRRTRDEHGCYKTSVSDCTWTLKYT